jgi:hypothetical protein
MGCRVRPFVTLIEDGFCFKRTRERLARRKPRSFVRHRLTLMVDMVSYPDA